MADITIIGIVFDHSDEVDVPALTGDVLADTLSSLLAQRLDVIRSGPAVTYTVHGQHYGWNGYLKVLDAQIMQVRREIAMSEPLEEISYGI